MSEFTLIDTGGSIPSIRVQAWSYDGKKWHRYEGPLWDIQILNSWESWKHQQRLALERLLSGDIPVYDCSMPSGSEKGT
jgi:hypothetical protein